MAVAPPCRQNGQESEEQCSEFELDRDQGSRRVWRGSVPRREGIRSVYQPQMAIYGNQLLLRAAGLYMVVYQRWQVVLTPII